MERYVQYGFSSVKQRDAVFGANDNDGKKWNVLSDMSKVYESLKSDTDNEKSGDISIVDLLKLDTKPFSINQKDDEEKPERFNTIIDFSNFLLHILKIQTNLSRNLGTIF